MENKYFQIVGNWQYRTMTHKKRKTNESYCCFGYLAGSSCQILAQGKQTPRGYNILTELRRQIGDQCGQNFQNKKFHREIFVNLLESPSPRFKPPPDSMILVAFEKCYFKCFPQIYNYYQQENGSDIPLLIESRTQIVLFFTYNMSQRSFFISVPDHISFILGPASIP